MISRDYLFSFDSTLKDIRVSFVKSVQDLFIQYDLLKRDNREFVHFFPLTSNSIQISIFNENLEKRSLIRKQGIQHPSILLFISDNNVTFSTDTFKFSYPPLTGMTFEDIYDKTRLDLMKELTDHFMETESVLKKSLIEIYQNYKKEYLYESLSTLKLRTSNLISSFSNPRRRLTLPPLELFDKPLFYVEKTYESIKSLRYKPGDDDYIISKNRWEFNLIINEKSIETDEKISWIKNYLKYLEGNSNTSSIRTKVLSNEELKAKVEKGIDIPQTKKLINFYYNNSKFDSNSKCFIELIDLHILSIFFIDKVDELREFVLANCSSCEKLDLLYKLDTSYLSTDDDIGIYKYDGAPIELHLTISKFIKKHMTELINDKAYMEAMRNCLINHKRETKGLKSALNDYLK